MEETSCVQPTHLVQGPAATVIAEKAPPSQSHPPPPSSSPSDSDDDGEFEFEFPFVSRDSPAGTAAPADELFANGRIKPFYPVFGRHGVFFHEAAQSAAPSRRVRGQLGRLFLEESRARNRDDDTASASGSHDADDGLRGGLGLEGAPPPESYCLWTPRRAASSPRQPPRPRKSGSTGSVARWRRISDLVVGRSHSDGKDKFAFFFAAPQQPKLKHVTKPSTKDTAASGAAAADLDTVAHRPVAYVAKGAGTPRRTFLPYREELVGFFANVNGSSRVGATS